MSFERLKKISKPFAYPVAIDRRFSITRRIAIQRGLSALFTLAAVLALGAAMVPFAGYPIYVGMMFILLGVWLIVFAVNVYVFSFQFRELSDPDTPITFEVAAAVNQSHGRDVTLAFFANRFGGYLWRRLGLGSEDLEQFASERSEPKYDLSIPDDEQADIYTYARLIYENDAELRNFLASRRITDQLYDGAARWVRVTMRRIKVTTRWWARPHLRSLSRLGVDWSFGMVSTLRRFARPVSVSAVGPVDTEQYYDDIADRIEGALSRQRSANALLVAEEGAGVRHAFEVVVRRIQNGSVSDELQYHRLYRLDLSRLLEAGTDKTRFEKLFLKLMHEAEQAGNVVLIVEHLAAFLAQAGEYGASTIDLMERYLESPDLHFIATTNPAGFHNTIEPNTRITRWFDVLHVEVGDEEKVNQLLAKRAEYLEVQYNIAISYPALYQVYQGARQYVTEQAMPESAVTLLTEVAARAGQQGRAMVTRKFVNGMIEEKTGVKTGEISDEEQTKLENLEGLLHKRIVGQDEAVAAVSNALRRARSGLADQNRPYGSFLFLGPTGVGKTETVKALADVFYDGRQDIVRLDMSEFTGPDALTRLIGDSAGTRSGVLASKVRENPYAVLLLDEFEKATRDVHDLFLRIFDEGVFHDATDREVNLRSMIIIATSNAGSDEIHRIVSDGKDLADQKDRFLSMLIDEQIFRPELLNRFDDIVLYHPLAKKHLTGIAKRELAKLGNRLEQRGIGLEITEPLIRYLVEHGHDKRFGARAMQRVIKNDIEKLASHKIINGEVAPGETLRIDQDELDQLNPTSRERARLRKEPAGDSASE